MVVSIPRQVGDGRVWIRAYGVADASARAAVSASRQPIEPGFKPQTALAPPVVHSRHAIESASKAQGPVMSARLLGASARPISGSEASLRPAAQLGSRKLEWSIMQG